MLYDGTLFKLTAPRSDYETCPLRKTIIVLKIGWIIFILYRQRAHVIFGPLVIIDVVGDMPRP